MQKKLFATINAKEANLSCIKNPNEAIEEYRKEIDKKTKKLNSLKNAAKRTQKYRSKQRLVVTAALKNPDIKNLTNIHQQTTGGRPRLEEDQPELLRAISEIAMFGASADERRRSNVLRSCKTLKQLKIELEKLGFEISETATYHRLLPKNSKTKQGKRHVKTVPVKLCRAQSDLHKDHPDQNFCRSIIRDLESLASILGPYKTSFLSADDKARVPIGITAAKAQSPFLMHVEYTVRLPDHDFVISSQHKLIPSVYIAVEIEENRMGCEKAISYSGPTYIAIRSAKHSTSSAATHSKDLSELLNIKDFQNFLKLDDNQVKPVIIITTDGGSDENPRFPNVINHAVDYFKKYNLDALFWATNAPGRSAFNRVERRMAPLSRELSGVVIPHDKFGTHLNSSGKVINKDLEKKNFEYAGEILAEIWGNMVIDGYPVTAKYISPDEEQFSEPWSPTHPWYIKHVKESQYFLQVNYYLERNFYKLQNLIFIYFRLSNVMTNLAAHLVEVTLKKYCLLDSFHHRTLCSIVAKNNQIKQTLLKLQKTLFLS